jgi:hypothetical protein
VQSRTSAPAGHEPCRLHVPSPSVSTTLVFPAQPLWATASAIVSDTDVKATPATPQPEPPSKGTLRSAVPWTCRTGTGRAGSQGWIISVPATGPMARMRAASSHARRYERIAPFEIPMA